MVHLSPYVMWTVITMHHGLHLSFMLVSHTQQSVIIPQKVIGEKVNIEVDVLAKMVERSLAGITESSSSSKEVEITLLKSKVASLERKVEKLIETVETLSR